MRKLQNPWLIPVACGLLATGCMPVLNYDLARTPTVNLAGTPDENAEDQVFAFRIENVEDHWGHEGSSAASHARIRMIRSSAAGEVPAQRTGDCDYGWEGLGCADTTSKSASLRLYRRGFATVEISPGPGPAQVLWQKAADWHEQERALDILLAPPTTSYARAKYGHDPGPLLWINTDLKYSEPLLFAADEYDRIAALLPASARADRERLTEKSRNLHTAAAQILPLKLRPRAPYP